MERILMFTTSHCVNCPKVKEELGKKDVVVEYVDAEERPELAMDHVIMTVPTIVDGEKKYVGQQACLDYVDSL